MCVFQSPVCRMRMARSITWGSSMPTACGTPAVRCHKRAVAAATRMSSRAIRRIQGGPAQDITCTMIADMAHAFTIGVEEEFQIVDPDTFELRSHVSELLTAGAATLGDQIKRELHQSIVEVGTRICGNVAELEEQVCHIRRELSQSAESVGLRIAAAGTHPFSRWKDQVISPGERYENIVEELQQLARSLLIFGLHIHVAVPDRASTIELLNEARYFLPHLLALSTSSPFWQGRDTGLKSYRTTVFRRF